MMVAARFLLVSLYVVFRYVSACAYVGHLRALRLRVGHRRVGRRLGTLSRKRLEGVVSIFTWCTVMFFLRNQSLRTCDFVCED